MSDLLLSEVRDRRRRVMPTANDGQMMTSSRVLAVFPRVLNDEMAVRMPQLLCTVNVLLGLLGPLEGSATNFGL